MKKKICIVDYKIGNIASITNALKNLKYDFIISSSKINILNSDLLILPGVGTFGEAINNLKKKNIDKIIYERDKLHKPILGICLGMQLLAKIGYENEKNYGLNLINGQVEKIDKNSHHIGWNDIKIKKGFLKQFDKKLFYFNHGYFFKTSKKYSIADVYFKNYFPAIIKKGNICGIQFHPERSHSQGLEILNKIIENLTND